MSWLIGKARPYTVILNIGVPELIILRFMVLKLELKLSRLW